METYMRPKKEIKLVHFQITKNCNLRCPFCGQWGGKGFFASANGEALKLEEWLGIANELKTMSPLPKIILWGGEPLVCPFFDELAEKLFEMGFTLQLITNGTLIDRNIDVIRNYFERVYVSVDGLRELHDSIRGNGTFDTVRKNILMLESKKVTIMTVATPSLDIVPFAKEFSDYKILLQTMIALSEAEAEDYKAWLEESFAEKATEIDSWCMQGFEPSFSDLPKNVIFMGHGRNAKNEFCLSPFRHIHISWNGSLLYCTDFYDFSAGNVRDDSVINIFNNERSEKFRQEVLSGGCVTCSHCSWRNNIDFY